MNAPEQRACVLLLKMKSEEQASLVKVASNDTAIRPEDFTIGFF